MSTNGGRDEVESTKERCKELASALWHAQTRARQAESRLALYNHHIQRISTRVVEMASDGEIEGMDDLHMRTHRRPSSDLIKFLSPFLLLSTGETPDESTRTLTHDELQKCSALAQSTDVRGNIVENEENVHIHQVCLGLYKQLVHAREHVQRLEHETWSRSTQAMDQRFERLKLSHDICCRRLNRAHLTISRLKNACRTLEANSDRSKRLWSRAERRIAALEPLISKFEAWDRRHRTKHMIPDCVAVHNAELSWLSFINMVCGGLLACSTFYNRILVFFARLIRLILPGWLTPINFKLSTRHRGRFLSNLCDTLDDHKRRGSTNVDSASV